MCGFGSSNSGALRDQERQETAERDTRNRLAARINTIFGIEDPNYNPLSVSAGGLPGGGFIDLPEFVTGPNGEQIPLGGTAGIPSTAGQNRSARDGQLQSLRQAILDRYNTDLGEQRTTALRGDRFQLARQGLAGGSAELDLGGLRAREASRGVVDITNRADGAVNAARTADEQARADLISRVQAGLEGDSALTAASSTLQGNLRNAQSAALDGGLGQVFSGLANAELGRAQLGRSSLIGGGGTFFNPSSRSTYGGSVRSSN